MTPSNERVRTRAQRVASRIDYNGFSQRLKKLVMDDNGLKKLALVFAAAAVVTIICGAWDPPLKFTIGSMPDRDIVCNAAFSAVNAWKTSSERSVAQKNTPRYYEHDPAKLIAYKGELRKEMRAILGVVDLSHASDEDRAVVRKYLSGKPKLQDEKDALETLQLSFEDDVDLVNYMSLLDKIFMPFEKDGVLKEKGFAKEAGTADVVKVFDFDKTKRGKVPAALPAVGKSAPSADAKIVSADHAEADSLEVESFAVTVDRMLDARTVPMTEVSFAGGLVVKGTLYSLLSHDRRLADLLFERIRREPPETLVEDAALTRIAQADAMRRVGDIRQTFTVGEPIVPANKVIDSVDYYFLREERKAALANRSLLSRCVRFTATLFLNLLLMVSAFFIIVSKRLAHNANNVRHTLKDNAVFLGFFILFFLTGRLLLTFFPEQGMSMALVPIVIFVELITFSVSWGVALTIGVILSIMLTVSQGGGPEVFIPLCGVSVFVAFLARSVRTRLQLVSLAVNTGLCAFLLSIVTNLLTCDYVRPEGAGLDSVFTGFILSFQNSVMQGAWGFAGGVLSTCVLPVVELYFHVVTPMQLLEYANPSHPLMIELNQKAPATYNHSIQTSTLAEAAAEAIGARAYLVKVGAYFHDVGKMMNPEYFTENQNGFNIHDELSPRMSALAIVAHVKDGVTTGRNHKLPREIVDLIEQHHGTMLVSFFYQRALKAALETDPDARLDEGPFRYPGPIPQTKEAGVLMLADAVESASRSLADWSPRRVENLVRKITEMRIEDGQFRDSGLTFGEIQTIQQSLVTSILASRHSRVKYPDDKDKEKDKEKESKEPQKDANPALNRPDDGKSAIIPPAQTRSEDSQILSKGDRSRTVRSEKSDKSGDGSSSGETSRIIKTPH